MITSDGNGLVAVAAVDHGEDATRLLSETPAPATVRAIALRADELRFEEAKRAVGVAEAALAGFFRLPPSQQRPGIACLAWATYGSILRTLTRLDESELALAVAASVAPRCRYELRTNLKRRLAYLRADQGNAAEALGLVRHLLDAARDTGGSALGKELVNAGAILMLMKDFQGAAVHLEESLLLLPTNGDKRHLSAVGNLARCRLELSATPTELASAMELVEQTARLIESGSYSELRLRWLAGSIHHRLGNLDLSLEQLESTRQGIDQLGDGYDRALLVLDIAELHLECRDAASAYELARSSFGILSALSKDKEAFRAMRVFYAAGVSLSLDRATVHDVRERLVELRRRPRGSER